MFSLTEPSDGQPEVIREQIIASELVTIQKKGESLLAESVGCFGNVRKAGCDLMKIDVLECG